MSELRMDGIPLGVYLQDSLTRFRDDGQTPSKEMFWASNERTGNDAVRDVLQIEFSGERLVNHISLQVSRFPHRITAEFWDPLSDNWLPLREQIADIEPIDPAYDISAQRAKWEGDPVQFTVTDSYPAQIDATANARSLGLNHHPQHFGAAHWVNVKWRTVPVLTRAIRLILVRSSDSRVSPDTTRSAPAALTSCTPWRSRTSPPGTGSTPPPTSRPAPEPRWATSPPPPPTSVPG